MKSHEFLGKLTNDNVAHREVGACGSFSWSNVKPANHAKQSGQLKKPE